LIIILQKKLELNRQVLEELIIAMTAHKSKGQEAHTVIILDANERQFPKIHPDNLLFEDFGVTPHSVLEDERRLFYVAATRAEHSLYALAYRDTESPFLKALRSGPIAISDSEQACNRGTKTLGELAMKIQKKISQLM